MNILHQMAMLNVSATREKCKVAYAPNFLGKLPVSLAKSGAVWILGPVHQLGHSILKKINGTYFTL